MFRYILIFLLLINFSCNFNEKVEEYTDHDIVIVNLSVDSSVVLESVSLEYHNQKEKITLTKQVIGDQKQFKFKFPQRGEVTYLLCIQSIDSATCFEDYVEGGYRPEVFYGQGGFSLISSFGGPY